MIYIGSDHAGFDLKETVIKLLLERGEKVNDLGTDNPLKADYPEFAKLVGESTVKHRAKGILICRSGQGMVITANKVLGVRAIVAWNAVVAQKAKKDINNNILCLPAGFITKDQAEEIVMTWLDTPFSSAERHIKRIKMITEMEKKKEICEKDVE